VGPIKPRRAGVAEREITPDGPVDLAHEMKPVRSSGVGSRLWARAAVLGGGKQTLAVVSLDLYGLQSACADQLTAAICAAAGTTPESVMVFCSRTRNSPVTAPIVGHEAVDGEYVAQIAGTVAEAVREAVAGMREASIGYGRAILPHLVYNHRLVTRNYKSVTAWLGVPASEVIEPEGPIDPELGVLVIREAGGGPMCVMWTMGADNRFLDGGTVSADLPGWVQAGLDERAGAHVPALYIPGCGGNVSFIHGREQTADAVADSVMAVQLETPCDSAVVLRCAAEKVVLPTRDTSQFWSEPDIELKLVDARDLFARELEILRQENAPAVPAQVKVFRIGDLALVGLPGVPFCEFSLQIKDASPFPATMVGANQGRDIGYILTRKAFAYEGYEAWPSRSARIGPGAGEFLTGQVDALLRSLTERYLIRASSDSTAARDS